MFHRSRVLFVALLGVFLFTAGCASGGSAPMAATPSKGLVVTTGNGAMVYVPTNDGKGVNAIMASAGAKPCPQCEADAVTYFQTGKLTTTCSECHATRVPVSEK